ncbi:hypothetical protein BDV59DRAFT_204066 [Aspergillus ambiguus]|uniref:uncharacterized protein n=1 Tax=Aspergillus ambiguus TaxID=176160 RepID=UPI003CCD9D6E
MYSKEFPTYSNNPKCGCQPYPRKNKKVEITLRGGQPNQFCELHQPGATLDVIFNLIDNNLILRETIRDPTRRYTFWKFGVEINYEHMEFGNMIGLADSSLLLSLRLKKEACGVKGNMLMVKEKNSGFARTNLESRLNDKLYLCDWPEKYLEIFLPEEKLVGWKTVALIAKTFNRITVDQWSDIVWMKSTPPVAGLDWRALEYEVMEEEKRRMAGVKETMKSFPIKYNSIKARKEDQKIANCAKICSKRYK